MTRSIIKQHLFMSKLATPQLQVLHVKIQSTYREQNKTIIVMSMMIMKIMMMIIIVKIIINVYCTQYVYTL